jgi:hypothetical protein
MNTITQYTESLEKHILQNDLLLYIPNQENAKVAPKYLVNAIKHQMLDLGYVLSDNLESKLFSFFRSKTEKPKRNGKSIR